VKKNIMFVGLDVHKNSIEIATADEGRDGEIGRHGSVGGDLVSLNKALRKLQSRGRKLRVVYEAGPCGYEIYRHLTAKGIECDVVAPSMTPKRSGVRVKTDPRDALMLARLHRAGELTTVYVPKLEDEAIRDLTRARQDAKNAERRARQQLKALLLRNGIRYQGKTSWTPAHMRWLSEIKLPHPAQQIVCQEYIDTVQTASQRVARITQQIQQQVNQWRMRPVIDALQALRGVQLIVAATLVAELGDIARFENPRQLMAYLGLVPSEASSGDSVWRGSITKTGNTHARTALVQAAWNYRRPARVSRSILLRHQQLQIPKSILQIAWKGQLRLCQRFRYLTMRGKSQQKVVVAIARELAGFVWAIAKEITI
jgi:transposase